MLTPEETAAAYAEARGWTLFGTGGRRAQKLETPTALQLPDSMPVDGACRWKGLMVGCSREVGCSWQLCELPRLRCEMFWRPL